MHVRQLLLAGLVMSELFRDSRRTSRCWLGIAHELVHSYILYIYGRVIEE